eukprot:15434348-Alexandrium_andersonii.AAC.2
MSCREGPLIRGRSRFRCWVCGLRPGARHVGVSDSAVEGHRGRSNGASGGNGGSSLLPRSLPE